MAEPLEIIAQIAADPAASDAARLRAAQFLEQRASQGIGERLDRLTRAELTAEIARIRALLKD